MPDHIIDIICRYYGIDWLGLLCGVTGMYMITRKIRWGFLISSFACLCGFTVASMGGQYGYVAYNAILFCLMLKGFQGWSLRRPIPGKISTSTQPGLS